MAPDEKEPILRRLESWRAADERLRSERAARLRAMTDDDSSRAVQDLLSLPLPPLPERGSGLVEQQRAFRRAR